MRELEMVGKVLLPPVGPEDIGNHQTSAGYASKALKLSHNTQLLLLLWG